MSKNSKIPFGGGYFNTLWRGRDRFMGKEEVLKIVGLSKSTIYRMIKAGQFPRPLKAPGGCLIWYESEILEWLKRVKKAA